MVDAAQKPAKGLLELRLGRRAAGKSARNMISRTETQRRLPGLAEAINAAVFGLFFSYAIWFLMAHGHELNSDYVYHGGGAWVPDRQLRTSLSLGASLLFTLWMGLNYSSRPAGAERPLARIFLTALALRLVPAMTTFGATTDMATFEFVQKAALSGNHDLYMGHAPYLPFISYVLHLLGLMNVVLRLPAYFVIKLVPVAFDSAMIFPIFLLTGDRGAAGKYAWNPATMMISAIHGQFDAVTMFFVVLALYFVSGKASRVASGLCFGAAVQSKWWPVMLSPVILLRLKGKDAAVFVLSWVAVFLAFSFPYLSSDPGLMLKPFEYLGVPRDYGIAGLMYYLTKLTHAERSVFSVLIHILRVVCIIGLAWAVVVSRKWEATSSAFFILLTFYLLCPGWAVQYFEWLTVFLFLTGRYRSVLYHLFTVFLFLAYFLIVAFNSSGMLGMSEGDTRMALMFVSLLLVAAAVPLWRSMLESNGAAARPDPEPVPDAA
jgi:hypothetical protein